MKDKISIKFTASDKTAYIELDDSRSPKTVKAILDKLPIEVKINRWGDELYTDKTLIVAEEENAQSVVKPLDVAYWPEGNALCLFYGSTPISKSPDKILPYSPVNIVGKIITKDDILEEFKDDSTVVSPDEDKVRNIDDPETKQMRGYLHSEVKDLIESWILPIET